MQCSECNYIPRPEEADDPSRCPKCHVFYHKGLARKLRQVEAELQGAEDELKSLQQAEASPIIKPPVIGYRVREAIADYQGATPVVVLDLKMSFFSMIWFMVKWALASIPAFVILVAIGAFVVSLAGGLSRFI